MEWSVARAPVVLIVSEHEWASRSLDTILAPRGYAVLRAYNGEQAMERAVAADPDAVFIELNLPDGKGTDLCRQLLAQGAVGPATPLMITTSGPVTQEQRIEALRAGAWEVLTIPLDAEELLLRLNRYTRAKLTADRLQQGGLLDPDTGFYSRSGILQRAGEVMASAERYGRPLACIIFEAGEEGQEGDVMAGLVEILRSGTRKSDILGRVGPGQFAVLAPDTPRQGAQIVADRLRTRMAARGPGGGAYSPRAGVFAISNMKDAHLDATELMFRAVTAARDQGAGPNLN